jgi:acetyl-CoA acetyltransferase
MRSAAVVGIGRTTYTKASGRTPLAMATEAARAALDDAGLSPSDVDGIVEYQTGDSARAQQVGAAMGVDDLAWAVDISGGGNVACTAVADALSAVARGACEVAVVYRSLNGRSGSRYGRAEATPMGMDGEMQFAAMAGYVVPPMWIAMWARRHMHTYGTTAEDFGRIAVTQRAHAAANEHATQRAPLTMDGYMAGRWIYEPFRLYDCCLETDGACAVVITTLDRARDLRHVPVVPLAEAEAHTYGGSWDQPGDLSEMYSAKAGPRLWSRTDLSPSDVDVACMYDCFTYTVLATFEDFGFCGKGEVGDFFAEGRATYGGDVVVNPHGGLLSEAYIHGINHHYEAVLQLRGEAGDRQVRDAEVALVTAGAGPFGGAILYGADR